MRSGRLEINNISKNTNYNINFTTYFENRFKRCRIFEYLIKTERLKNVRIQILQGIEWEVKYYTNI